MTGPGSGPGPRLLVLTDRSQCRGPLLDVLAEVVAAGVRAVVLREKDLPEVERRELADRARDLLAPVGGVLVVAGRGTPTDQAVHLGGHDPFPEPRPALVGRSCHTAAEVAAATREGCDYVTVSPVFPTASKPGYGPPLGLDGLGRLVRQGPPAYALAGVRPDDVQGCLAAGAWGVAVMGGLMREPWRASTYLDRVQEVPA